MTKIKSFSALLTEDDYSYLASKYALDVNAVGKMTDDDWMAYLNVSKGELAFYLLDDDTYDDSVSLEELLIEDEDDVDEDETDWNDLLANDDYAEVVPITRQSPAKKSYTPTPRPYQSTGYASPSPMATKTPQAVIPHYYEVIK